MTKTLILDTNVYLTESQALFSFGRSDIAIPSIILDEIDKHKHRQDTAEDEETKEPDTSDDEGSAEPAPAEDDVGDPFADL